MSDQLYTAPKADLNNPQTIPNNGKRGATTAFGWVILVLGALGLLIAGFGLFAILEMDISMFGLSQEQLLTDALLSILSKFALITLGVALIIRASWVKQMTIAGFMVSTTDTIFKAIFVIPAQAAAAGSSAEQTATYFGAYFVALISALIYIGIWFYLRSAASKQEFNLS